ncbi:MAG: cadherin domain-containing protein, partial [Rhizobiales bacterium]|nr:cadherin domain-containing protein [Hyphomicrobiales bacterium]
PVDFETSSTLDFVVIATSGESSSETSFTVDVTNINEFVVQEPEDVDAAFNQVPENAAIGTPVGIIAVAFDADGDTVTYNTVKPDNSHGPFAIDAQTGIVFVAGELDAERRIPQNDVTVIATSSDGTTSEQRFFVKILDVSEFDVAWEYNYQFTEANIREDAALGTIVDLQLTANDKDISDELTFVLENEADLPFEIDPNTGVITVSQSLSELGIASYSLDVRATSTDGSFARETFDVPVDEVDEYELSDITDLDNAHNEVDSNAQDGTPVGITAFAEDLDASDVVTYSLTYSRSESESPFKIDSETGVITVYEHRWLDTGARSFETVRVEARSNAHSSQWFDFEIAIHHVNEYRVGIPYDTDNALDEVEENAPIGTLVGITALAEDRDTMDTVTYRLAPIDDQSIYASPNNDSFAIDPDTGVITVAGPIDYEASRSASILVVAVSSDGTVPEAGYPDPVSRFDIKILPINEFDLTPFVDTDEAPNEVSDEAGYGTPVGITLTTSDPDDVDLYGIDIIGVDRNNGWDGPFAIRYGKIVTGDPEKLKALGTGPHTLMVQATSGDGSERTEDVTIDILGPKKWYDDPQGKRVIADYPTVTKADRQACVDIDDNRAIAATFNNENAFFDCIEKAVPVVLWRDDPQGPRVDADYTSVPQTSADNCRRYDEDVYDPDRYNNENAYFNCMDKYLPTAAPADLADNPAAACAWQYKLKPEASDEWAKVTITNNHGSPIQIEQLGFSDWRGSYVTSIQPGETAEIKPKFDARPRDPRRGVVLVGFDENRTCVGAGKPMDAENSFSFGTDNSQTADSGPARRRDRGGSSRDSTDVQLANRCGERGQIVSNYIDEEANVTIRNTGNSELNVYWVDYDGNEGNYNDENLPIATAPGGQDITVDAWRGSVFIVTDEAGECVGIAEARETGNDYTYGNNSFNPANDDHNIFEDTAPKTRLQDTQPADDSTDLDIANGCSDRGRISSRFEEISRIVSIANTGSDDLEIYWVNYDGDEVNYDGDREPQVIVLPGQRVEIDAWQYFAFVVVDQAQQCVGIAHANSADNDYSYGDGSHQINSDAANDNQQSGDREPGWDRETVFYEPAYNYCTGEKGYEQGTEEYATCYYAY